MRSDGAPRPRRLCVWQREGLNGRRGRRRRHGHGRERGDDHGGSVDDEVHGASARGGGPGIGAGVGGLGDADARYPLSFDARLVELIETGRGYTMLVPFSTRGLGLDDVDPAGTVVLVGDAFPGRFPELERCAPAPCAMRGASVGEGPSTVTVVGETIPVTGRLPAGATLFDPQWYPGHPLDGFPVEVGDDDPLEASAAKRHTIASPMSPPPPVTTTSSRSSVSFLVPGSRHCAGEDRGRAVVGAIGGSAGRRMGASIRWCRPDDEPAGGKPWGGHDRARDSAEEVCGEPAGAGRRRTISSDVFAERTSYPPASSP